VRIITTPPSVIKHFNERVTSRDLPIRMEEPLPLREIPPRVDRALESLLKGIDP